MNKKSEFRERGTDSELKNRQRFLLTEKLAVASILCATAIFLLSSGAISADKTESDIEATRTAIEKWVDTQRVISKEKRDFALAKEMLNERIELVQREIQSLRGKIDEAEKNIAEADEKRQEMMEENDKLKQASAALEDTLIALEDSTKQLVKRLPHPFQQTVKPLSQQLPDNPEETKLTTSARFQNVVGILNEVNKANRKITVTSEVRDLDDGTSVEVTTLYAGIGQGFYAGANGKLAGYGFSSAEGWEWVEENDSAPQISDAIAIYENEKVAAFVQVPVKIK